MYFRYAFVVLLLSFFVVIHFHNFYNCTGDWDSKCDQQTSTDSNEYVCVKEGQGECIWRVGVGIIFQDPWFLWETKYLGSWKNDMKFGFGSYWSMSGTRYEGEWKDDKRNGFGTLFLPSQNVNESFISGNWILDKLIDADGKLVKNSDEFYNGNLDDGVMHGFGSLHLNYFEIIAQFTNGFIQSKSGYICIIDENNDKENQKWFEILEWNDKLEWNYMNTTASIRSYKSNFEYKLQDNHWNCISNTQNKDNIDNEIELLKKITEYISNFEEYFFRYHMQINNEAYHFPSTKKQN